MAGIDSIFMPPVITRPPVYDVSHWIEIEDFRALDPFPWLVLTKASQGTQFYDPSVDLYAAGIRDAGIRLGLYHYIEPGDEIAQANWFCDVLDEVVLRGDEVLALDMEVTGVSLEQCKRFMDRVQQRTGIRPIFYSTELLIESLYLTPNVPPAWLKDEWLWIAEYVAPTGSEIPDFIVPAGCSKSKIALWQYSDDGVVGGIPKNNVDLNLINQSFINHIQLQEPIQGVKMRYQMTTISTGTRIRPDHNTAGAAVGTIPNANTVIQGDELFTAPADLYNGTLKYQARGDQWLKTTYNNVTGWVALTHMGSPICKNFVDNGATEPPPPPAGDKPVSVTVELEGYQPLILNGTMKPNP